MSEGKTDGQAAYRKKPVVIEAVQWTGDNYGEIAELTGSSHFDVLDDQDRANCGDPEATATVFDKLHSTWVLVMTGQWIIRGVKGEFYPCADDVFRETYEPAIAAAGAAPAHERTAELLREVNVLRKLVAEIISKASILTAYDGGSELSELIDYLSQRAGIVPAVTTSGTEHLAAEFTDGLKDGAM